MKANGAIYIPSNCPSFALGVRPPFFSLPTDSFLSFRVHFFTWDTPERRNGGLSFLSFYLAPFFECGRSKNNDRSLAIHTRRSVGSHHHPSTRTMYMNECMRTYISIFLLPASKNYSSRRLLSLLNDSAISIRLLKRG